MTNGFRNVESAPCPQEPLMLTAFTDRLMLTIAHHDERGQAMVEYALILVLCVILVIVILTVMGNTVKNMFCNVAGSLNH
jgi:Flp pilus assembly pilin Flp